MQSRVVRKGAVLGERAAKQRARGLDCHCGHEMYVLASHKLLSCRPSLLHHSEQHLSCLVEFTSQAIWQGIRKTGKTACRKKKSRGMELVVGSASHLSPFFTAFVALALLLLFWKKYRYAQRLGARCFQTSSVTGENVDAVFQHVADKCAARPRPPVNAAQSPAVRMQMSNLPSAGSKSSCC